MFDFARNGGIGLFVADELFQQFVALVLLGIEEVGKRALCDEYRAQELFVVEADDLWQLVPVGHLLLDVIIMSDEPVEAGDGAVVAHALEDDVPLGAVDAAVVGAESQFAVAVLLAARQDVAAVSGCQSVALAVVWRAEYFDVLVALALAAWVARCAVVERQADGVE